MGGQGSPGLGSGGAEPPLELVEIEPVWARPVELGPVAVDAEKRAAGRSVGLEVTPQTPELGAHVLSRRLLGLISPERAPHDLSRASSVAMKDEIGKQQLRPPCGEHQISPRSLERESAKASDRQPLADANGFSRGDRFAGADRRGLGRERRGVVRGGGAVDDTPGHGGCSRVLQGENGGPALRLVRAAEPYGEKRIRPPRLRIPLARNQ